MKTDGRNCEERWQNKREIKNNMKTEGRDEVKWEKIQLK